MITVKRNLAALAFASVLLSPAAFAQSVGDEAGINSISGLAPKTEDFIKEAATSDILEIEAGKLAQFKGTPDEKKFAAAMIAAHTKTSADLKSMLSDEMKAALPAVLDGLSQMKLDKLRHTKPADFPGEYDPMQVSAHKDAVSLFERYAEGGDDPKLRAWAGTTLPTLRHHLEMAQAMDKDRR